MQYGDVQMFRFSDVTSESGKKNLEPKILLLDFLSEWMTYLLTEGGARDAYISEKESDTVRSLSCKINNVVWF